MYYAFQREKTYDTSIIIKNCILKQEFFKHPTSEYYQWLNPTQLKQIQKSKKLMGLEPLNVLKQIQQSI
jgi:hypothetical protein